MVDPENWQAVMLFCQCATQWKYGAMGGVMGLDYPGVKTVLDLTVEKSKRAELFSALQVMERAAMVIMNEKQAKQAKK